MGDCLLLTSPVRALRSEFPSFRVSVLVDARFAPCFSGNPDFEEVIPVHGKAATLLTLLRRRFDLVVNLHGGPTSLLFALAARGPSVGAEHYQYASLYRAKSGGRNRVELNSGEEREITDEDCLPLQLLE